MKNAVDAFNEIYCSVIKNIDINILQKTISFDLTLVDGGKTTDHKLKFENCTAFLWVEKMAESNEFNDNYDISKKIERKQSKFDGRTASICFI